MSLMDNLKGIVDQFTRGGASEGDVHAAYDEVASQASKSDLAAGLSHAFKSDQTPPFEQMVSGLFGQSNSAQKAGLLNQLLGSLGPGGGSQILSSLGMGSLAGALGGGAVTHQQAQEVSPEQVQSLARQAAAKDPSIMDKAAGFYAQHPTLVKTIGAGALAILMSRMSERRS